MAAGYWQGYRTLCSASVISVKAPVLMRISAPIMMAACCSARCSAVRSSWLVPSFRGNSDDIRTVIAALIELWRCVRSDDQ